jgi:hypothetical protein
MIDDNERVRVVAAEMRAAQLVLALTNAVTGAPHWRMEAQALLDKIEGGVLPNVQEQITTHRLEAA